MRAAAPQAARQPPPPPPPRRRRRAAGSSSGQRSRQQRPIDRLRRGWLRAAAGCPESESDQNQNQSPNQNQNQNQNQTRPPGRRARCGRAGRVPRTSSSRRHDDRPPAQPRGGQEVAERLLETRAVCRLPDQRRHLRRRSPRCVRTLARRRGAHRAAFARCGSDVGESIQRGGRRDAHRRCRADADRVLACRPWRRRSF